VLDLRDRFLEHLALHVLAGHVQRVEFLGQQRRLLRIVGGEQARAQVRRPNPTAGVDPRAEDEAGG
jgi:hypothetical protein